eukprot:gene2144-13879_t
MLNARLLGLLLLGACCVRGMESPVIGVLTMPWDANHTYLASAYVKLVEVGGGQVAPIHHEMGADEVTRLHASLNGVILPGGNG